MTGWQLLLGGLMLGRDGACRRRALRELRPRRGCAGALSRRRSRPSPFALWSLLLSTIRWAHVAMFNFEIPIFGVDPRRARSSGESVLRVEEPRGARAGKHRHLAGDDRGAKGRLPSVHPLPRAPPRERGAARLPSPSPEGEGPAGRGREPPSAWSPPRRKQLEPIRPDQSGAFAGRVIEGQVDLHQFRLSPPISSSTRRVPPTRRWTRRRRREPGHRRSVRHRVGGRYSCDLPLGMSPAGRPMARPPTQSSPILDLDRPGSSSRR